jgi:transcriptional regulator with XRE-family HTH domain
MIGAPPARDPLAMQAAADLMTRALARQSISRSELARRLDVTQPYVTELLSGRTNITVSTLARVLAVLGARLSLEASDCSPDPREGGD